MKTIKSLALASCFASLLAGCGQQNASTHAELSALTSELKPKIQGIPGAIISRPFAYETKDLADPFSLVKIADAPSVRTIGQPDQARPKEPLEMYALDSLSMAGAVVISGINFGVINADGRLHKIRAGQHLGRDFGVVLRVSQNEMLIKEMYQNFDGVWKEREVTMVIQDSNEAIKK